MKKLVIILLVIGIIAGVIASVCNSKDAQLSRINTELVDACTINMSSNPNLICD